VGKPWTRAQPWLRDPKKAFRRGKWRVYDAADWKPDFEPRQSITVFAVLADVAAQKVFNVHKIDDGKPSWGLPGGGVEIGQGEKPEEGIFREVLWESGYKIYRDESGKLIGADIVLDQQVTDTHKRLIFFSSMDMNAPQLPVKETDEIDEAGWFTLREILDRPSFPYDSSAIDPNFRNYMRETHVGYIFGVLSTCGCLGDFGLEEAGPEDSQDDDLKIASSTGT